MVGVMEWLLIAVAVSLEVEEAGGLGATVFGGALVDTVG